MKLPTYKNVLTCFIYSLEDDKEQGVFSAKIFCATNLSFVIPCQELAKQRIRPHFSTPVYSITIGMQTCIP